MEKELIYYEQIELTLYEGDSDGYKVKAWKKGDTKKDLYYYMQDIEREIDCMYEFNREQRRELKRIYDLISEYLSIKDKKLTAPKEFDTFELLNYDYNNNTIYINNYKLELRVIYTISDHFNYTVDQFVLDGNYYNSITDLGNAIFYNKDYFDLSYYDEFDCCKNHDTLYHEIDCLSDKFKSEIKFTCKNFEGCYTLKEIEINLVSDSADVVLFNFSGGLNRNTTNDIIEAYLYDNY